MIKKRTPKVRIVGGKFRGSNIPFDFSSRLRPTSNKTREILFNWLMHDVTNANCLDLFSGTGALGIEAISRGAKSVFFIEEDKMLYKQLHLNLKKLNALNAYTSEILEAPHSRSIYGIESLAKYRGSQVGLYYAEAFEVIRKIER